jgi:hypothetical protein
VSQSLFWVFSVLNFPFGHFSTDLSSSLLLHSCLSMLCKVTERWQTGPLLGMLSSVFWVLAETKGKNNFEGVLTAS